MEKIKSILKDKNKRYIVMGVAFLPILIVMFVFGAKAVKDIKGLKSLATDDVVSVVSNDHKIASMNYVLRDNQTDYQMQIFTELKNAIEKDNADDETIIGLVVKNHVADFYTFSNKLGQYDVGGLYYVDAPDRENVYIYARDTFYNLINQYMDQYGSENLPQVTNVEVTSITKAADFPITRAYKYDASEYQEAYNYVTVQYDAWDVKCNWTYTSGASFSTSNWPTSTTFKVIYNGDDARYEVVASGSMLDAEITKEGAK